MAEVNNVPQLVDKKGGSYAAIAPKLERGKFNKWKKRMLCYLAGMEPYYLKCIKDGPFQPKTTEGDDKPESQWISDERRVVVQDQRLKSIIMSCLPDDIMESVIIYETAKATWTDLVHSFEGPSDTKENRIMDLKLEYQTFRAKPTESLLQTYTRYKTLLNELANDGVNLSKHEINVGFVNSLPEKWLTFSQGLRNTNHTQTLDLADIYGRFIYEENLIQRRYSEEYLRELDIEYQERALLENSKCFIKRRNNFSSQKANENTECYKCGNKVSKGFQLKFTPKLIQSSSNSISQADTKFQKDCKAEYKKMKAKLALLEEEVSDEEEVTQVKVLMVLADDELTVRKNHARNGGWVDIAKRKKKILGGELFTESSSKMNENENLFVPASMGYDQEMVSKTKDWVERLNPDSKLPNFNTGRIIVPKSQAVNESLESDEILNTPESSKDSEAESLTPLPPLKNLQGASPSSEVMPLTFQPHSPRERPGLDEKVNSNQKTQESNSKIQKTESSKSVDSSRMSQDSKPKVQNIDSSKILYCMICKREDHRTLDHEMYTTSLKRSKNYKAQPYQYASSSMQILKAKAKPFAPCTHCGFNDHRPDDCRNYHECEICGSYDHFTSGHNRVIHIKGGVLAESSQSSESSIGVKCNTCGSNVHSTTDHNEFDHFKRETHQGAYLVPGQWMLKEYDWCQELSAQICRATRERIHDISYFHVFGCPVFIHNHKDHLGKFDAKADDGYFLGYSSVSKAFRVYNTRRQQIEETYHVTCNESMEAIRFTNTSVDEIGISDSSRYPPDEFEEDGPSRKYQVDSDVLYYIIPHG
ncbi:retrovirus-related pol polyprotein from transposon TNT 1-94 [Tanacetum coccineum]|uniref:Retrovirus-related pol polyprotein from transposon TNT 1-94 n=1 Tax=Tanacetum coccineum TaxID=301880 RepID=A0ABQ5A9T5_9ASTR